MGEFDLKNSIASSLDHPIPCIPVSSTRRHALQASFPNLPNCCISFEYKPISFANCSEYSPHPSTNAVEATYF